jgi:hypothetical protein
MARSISAISGALLRPCQRLMSITWYWRNPSGGLVPSIDRGTSRWRSRPCDASSLTQSDSIDCADQRTRTTSAFECVGDGARIGLTARNERIPPDGEACVRASLRDGALRRPERSSGRRYRLIGCTWLILHAAPHGGSGACGWTVGQTRNRRLGRFRACPVRLGSSGSLTRSWSMSAACV